MSLEWFAIGLLLLLVITLVVCLYQQKKQLSHIKESNDSQIKLLRQELTAFNSAAMGIGQRLILAEKKLYGTIEKQQELAENSGDFMHYSQAVDMAEKGADAQQLVDRCGLSENEANLVTLLHDAAQHNKNSSR